MPTTAFDGDVSEWIAVLPLAAIEQHGPHLPVGVDAYIAEGLVERCAGALPEDSPATFLPVQQICKSNEHSNFPGTVTVDWETVIRSWIDIGTSLARARVRKLLMVTSHGGNVSPMDIAARELRITQDLLVVTTSFGQLGNWRELYDYGPEIIDIHGGRAETSLMLALRPDLVDMGKAKNFSSNQSELKSRHSHLGYHSSSANIAWAAEDLNAEGVIGDASAATAEMGEEDIRRTVSGFCRLIEEIAATPAP